MAIHETFGFDAESKKFVPGKDNLCEITMQQAKDNAREVLRKVLGDSEAEAVSNKAVVTNNPMGTMSCRTRRIFVHAHSPVTRTRRFGPS